MYSRAAARQSRLRKSLLASGLAISIVAVGAPIAFAQVAEVVVTARKREENVQNIPVAVTSVSGKQIEKFNITSVQDVAQLTPQLIIARGSSGSGADISLRGIGTPTENIGIEQSVSVNIDGVYYGQGRVIDEGTFDVSGVQVLKGPQALFYGKNATAGALAMTTNDPGSTYQAGLTAGYEFTTENPYVEGYASGPVNDRFGLRLAFRYSDQQEGYIKNTATATNYLTTDHATGQSNSSPVGAPPEYLGQNKDLLLRLTGKWEPINNFTITGKVTFDQHHSNNNVDNGVIVYCPLGYPQSEAGLVNRSKCGHSFTDPQPQLPANVAAVPNSLESLAGGKDFERYQDTTEFLKFNYTGANFTLTSTNSFQHLFNDWADNQNFTKAPLVYAGEHFVWNQFSTEERGVTSFHSPVNFAGGFYFQTTHLQFAQDVDFLGAQNSAAPLPTDEFVAYNKSAATTGHTYAVFGQAIVDIIKNVELTGGARFTHEIKSSYFLQPYVSPDPIEQFLFRQYDPNDPNGSRVGAHQVFNNWSPEVTLTWKPVSNLTLYGAYKTGYKSGGFSNSAILSNLVSVAQQAPDFQFKPETAKGFEFGEKAILFDHQLRLNVDFFDYLYSNVQVDFFNTPTFNYITLNAASARTYGLEAEAEFAPKSIPGLTLNFDGAYNNAHYVNFLAPCTPAGLTYEQGCNIQRNVSDAGVQSFTPNCGDSAANLCNFMDVSGRPTALAPKWTAVIGGDYSRPISSSLKMDLALHARLSSSYLTNSFPSEVVRAVDRQSAYGMLDAVFSIGGTNNRWTLSLIGRNLTNEFVQTSSAGLPLSGGTSGCKVSACGAQLISDQLSTVLNPRTIALQLKVAY